MRRSQAVRLFRCETIDDLYVRDGSDRLPRRDLPGPDVLFFWGLALVLIALVVLLNWLDAPVAAWSCLK